MLFIVIMNIVQPVVQASLAAYISTSYDTGILTKDSDPKYLSMWYTLIFTAVSALLLDIGASIGGIWLLFSALPYIYGH